MIEITQEWIDKAKKLASQYAHDYSFVGDDSIKRSKSALFEHLESALPIDPHAELKELYSFDVETCKTIDGLEAWNLYQYHNSQYEHWEDCAINPSWQDIIEYRRNPHADNIIAYHKCSDADKKRWQISINKGKTWENVIPSEWCDKYLYRMKPRTIGVTLDDGTRLEFPEPLRENPNYGERYSTFDPETWSINSYTWENHADELIWSCENRIFRTAEDAKSALNAINAILSQRSE